MLALMFSFPLLMKAEVIVNIGFSIPVLPVIRFHEAPRMVVLPDTNIYVAPDVDVDIFFAEGWWWRPIKGNGIDHVIITRLHDPYLTQSYAGPFP